MVDYCHLLNSEHALVKEIAAFTDDNDIEEVETVSHFEVPITLPPKYAACCRLFTTQHHVRRDSLELAGRRLREAVQLAVESGAENRKNPNRRHFIGDRLASCAHDAGREEPDQSRRPCERARDQQTTRPILSFSRRSVVRLAVSLHR